METFVRTPQGFVARIETRERVVLSELLRQFIELMSDEGLGGAPSWDAHGDTDPLLRLERTLGAPQLSARLADPALRRLFPDAYRDDEEASAEYARLTRMDLRDAKVAAALQVGEDLGDRSLGRRLVVSHENVLAWMTTLTNLRLVMSERIHIEQLDGGFEDDIPEDDPRFAIWNLYNWLGWVQESLVDCVL
ncbi:MAG: DUF2017 domain-containing protein [Propionibacteriaceae bacterium]|jgi:hypothetical protein|nr:DUF2017 domain-containing protein [Propionibacteriaceae bacterium]